MGKSKELAELGSAVVQTGGTTAFKDDTLAIVSVQSGNAHLSSYAYASGFTYDLSTASQAHTVGTASSAPTILKTGNVERMRIDASGRVTMPYQPHISGSPRNTSGAGFANAFTTRTTPVGLSFSNDRITVPISGVYHISFNTISNNSENIRRDARVYINGVETINGLTETNTLGYKFKSVSLSLQLAANDYIQFLNEDWYDYGGAGYDPWRTASVTLLG